MEKEVMEKDMKKNTDTPPARSGLKDGGLKAVISVLAVVILLITAFGAVYGVYGWAFITTQPVKEYKAEMYAKASKDAPKGGVVFLGDSLTEMYDLSEHYPDLRVYNRGISGDTTDHMLERLESNVIALSPDVVVFLGGCNDIRHGVPISDVIENISQILGALKTARYSAVTVPDKHEQLRDIQKHTRTSHRGKIAGSERPAGSALRRLRRDFRRYVFHVCRRIGQHPLRIRTPRRTAFKTIRLPQGNRAA